MKNNFEESGESFDSTGIKDSIAFSKGSVLSVGKSFFLSHKVLKVFIPFTDSLRYYKFSNSKSLFRKDILVFQ